MLKNSKSVISTTYDQLINVIYKIQKYYRQEQQRQQQHLHYYINDLFYRCNITKKPTTNKRKKNTIQTKNKRNREKSKNNSKRKTLKCECDYNNNNSRSNISSRNNNNNNNIIINNNNNDNCSLSDTNSVASACCCADYNELPILNSNSYKICDYFRNIWLNIQTDYNNFLLVILIFLLALITTTAHNIDTQGKPQKKSTTTSPPLFTVSNDNVFASKATANFSQFTQIMPCSNAFNIKPNICHNLRYIYHRYRREKKHVLHKKSKLLKSNFNYQKDKLKGPPEWLISNKRIKLKNISNYIKSINYQPDDQTLDDTDYNLNTKVIKFKNKNKIPKDDEYRRNIINSTINKLLQNINTKNIITNNYNIRHDINNNDTETIREKTSKEAAELVVENEEETNVIKVNIDDNGDDYVEIKYSSPPPVTTTAFSNTFNDSLRSIDYTADHQQQIDHNKLLKLVMDGLGLKNVPNMKTVNISQNEYVTKYREYLQRVHTRKRRELRDVFGEYDESFLRPLEIFSIVSSNSIPEEYQGHSFNGKMRHKRNVPESDDDDDDRKQTLEERVKNILLLKKKYQKPRSTKKERDERKTNIRLMFALKPDILNLSSSDIEEANIRLVLIHSPILAIRNSKNRRPHTKPKNNSCSSNKSDGPKKFYQTNPLNLKLYFISGNGKRIWIDGQKIDIHVDLTKPDETHTQWLQFDVSKAVKFAIDDKRRQHIALELQCDNCKRIGARILNDAYNTAAEAMEKETNTEGHKLMPVLNIIGHFEESHRTMRPHKYDEHHSDTQEEATTQRHYHHQAYNNNKNRHNRRTNCYKANQRCCRHSMEVTFKEIKGFEFIIQPKVFDAGYCHGRCPPRYNPAHHHAMLQSLIWKQNHKKAPRPCCAPSKLVELEVLHVDEKDSEKLKISTWSDMKVVECACS